MKQHTLSFAILDDLCGSRGYGPIHVSIPDLTPSTIKKAVLTTASPFIKYWERVKNMDSWDRYPIDAEDEEMDPSGYYFGQNHSVSATFDPDDVVNDLVSDGYYVWNRFQKYYVIAYAIDYTRFEVYSKDCDKELIKWRDDDKNDTIEGIIDDVDYNENPVISLLKNK